MNKYLNIIVISFFSILVVNKDIAYSLVLPILFLYAIHNSKSFALFIVISLVSSYFLNKEFFISSLLVFIFIMIYLLVFNKRNNVIIKIMYYIILNIGIMLFLTESVTINNLVISFIYVIISVIVFLLTDIILRKNKSNFIYFEMIGISIAILGATTIEYKYDLAFILCCYYCMYFAINVPVLVSFGFSLIVSFFLIYYNKIDYAIILPIINITYYLKSILSSFIIIIMGFFVCLVYPQYYEIVLIIDIVSIVFEIFKNRNINSVETKNNTLNDIYKKSIENLNKDILAFSSFLDLCTKDQIINKKRQDIINDGILNLKNNYCNKCHIKNRCYMENIDINQDMRELISQSGNEDFNIKDLNTFSVCVYNVEMRKSALLIYKKLLMNNESLNMRMIRNTFGGASNILKQFVIDNSVKKEKDHDKLYKLKKAIQEEGYRLTFFNPVKMFENDFHIEIGIKDYSFTDIKEDFERICLECLDEATTIEYSHTERNKVYIYAIPKINCKVQYSSSNIASSVVSGDNILIKDDNNGKTIAMICDGMGKGEKASETSNNIIKMFEELNNTYISSNALIQILNTYCGINKDIESYSTLDYLEIDKRNKQANFYKMSAVASYIFHQNNKIEVIDNDLLPLGHEITVNCKTINLSNGDIIIMSSDGIFENIENEEELQKFIGSIIHMTVEKIVYQILNYVKSSKTVIDDDMSLIVLKVLFN